MGLDGDFVLSEIGVVWGLSLIGGRIFRLQEFGVCSVFFGHSFIENKCSALVRRLDSDILC